MVSTTDGTLVEFIGIKLLEPWVGIQPKRNRMTLSNERVRAIRKAIRQNPDAIVAQMFDITVQRVYRIRTRLDYGHVRD